LAPNPFFTQLACLAFLADFSFYFVSPESPRLERYWIFHPKKVVGLSFFVGNPFFCSSAWVGPLGSFSPGGCDLFLEQGGANFLPLGWVVVVVVQ